MLRISLTNLISGIVQYLLLFALVISFTSQDVLSQSRELVRGPYIQNQRTGEDGKSSVMIRFRILFPDIVDGQFVDFDGIKVCYKGVEQSLILCKEDGSKNFLKKQVNFYDKAGVEYFGVDFIITLTNLIPDTKYSYWVEKEDCPDKDCGQVYGFFNTPPFAGSSFTTNDPLKVWVLGDSGSDYYCEEGDDGAPCHSEMFRDAYLTVTGHEGDYQAIDDHPEYFDDTDLALLLGDISYGYNETENTIEIEPGSDLAMQSGFFDKYQKIMKYKPFYPSIGNHEITHGYISDYYKAFSTPSHTTVQFEGSQYPKAYYSFDYGNVHFVSLNSDVNSSLGLDPDQSEEMLAWFKNDLYEAQNVKNSRWIIVFFHNPVYSSGRHPESGPNARLMRDEFLPVIDSVGVDLVLNGDNHHYERSYLVKGFHHKNLGSCEDDHMSCWYRKNNNGSLIFQSCYFEDFVNLDDSFVNYGCDDGVNCPIHPDFSYTGGVHNLPFLQSPDNDSFDPILNFPGQITGASQIIDKGAVDNIYHKDDGEGTVYIVTGGSSKSTTLPANNYNCDTYEYYFTHPLMKKFREGDALYGQYDGGRGMKNLGSVSLEITDERIKVEYIGVDEITEEPTVHDSFIICKSGNCLWD